MRVGIYTRVSSDEQAKKGYSLEEQEATCLAFAHNQGWQVVEIYRDPGYTGATMNRPGLRALIADVNQQRIDIVLVWKTDRLSRWLPACVDLVLNTFDAQGVHFRSATEMFDTTTPAGRMLFAQLATFADFERSMIRERTLLGRESTARHGNWAGGRPPFGYVLTGERGSRHLEQDTSRAPIIERLFESIARGTQQRTLARELNDAGIHTGEGGYWTASKVRRIIQNPIYKGQPVWRRRKKKKTGAPEMLPEDEWVYGALQPELAIVTPETWERANRAISGGFAKRRGGWTKGRFLLTGLLRCGLCGAKYEPVVSVRVRKSASVYEGYRCGRKSHGGSSLCSNSLIPRALVENEVVKAALEHIDRFRTDPDYEEMLMKSGGDEAAEIKARIALIDEEIAQNRRALAKWYTAFEKDATATPEVVRDRLAELGDEKARLTALRDEATKALIEVEARTAEVAALHSLAPGFLDVWESMITEERKALLYRIIREVRVFPERRIEIELFTG